ncbi:tape measure protein [Hyphomicrobium sp. CS1GBMeth3]|uniref:tape measure protein n=1 Tax=Hyphomicrobium sp. CS1GBMeth3 TaxID=1892845 RepID=UPI000930B8AD|nr:tape measure protein [Hyphomicrobium sp. CS1GBMeth3]
MTDVASLGFEVDSAPLTKGATELDKLAAAAKRAEDAATGMGSRAQDAAKRAEAANTTAATSTRNLGDAYSSLDVVARRAAAAVGLIAGALSAAAISGLADSYSDLSARVGLAVRNMDASGVVMDRLADIARRTYSSLELTAESFVRNATTLRELGRSANETLDYTEALNLALVVSGARADRARQIQEAMTRAMASGALRGQELNTVIQNGGRVAEVLAEELGVGVNQLRGLGEQGKITADVIATALIRRMEQLRTETEKMPTTIGDAFQQMRNAVLQLIGVYDQQNQLSATLAENLKYVADNLDIAAKAALVAAAAFGVMFHASILASAVALTKAIGVGLVGAVTALGAVLLSNPLTAIATVIAGATAAASLFGDELRKSEGILGWFGEKVDWLTDKLYFLGDAFNAVRLKLSASSINDDAMQAVALSIAKLNEDLQAFEEARDRALGSGVSTTVIDQTIASIRGQITEATREHWRMNEVREASELSFTELVAREAQKRRELWAWERGTSVARDLGLDAAGTRSPEMPDMKAYDRRTEAVRRQVEAMKIEAETYGMTEAAAARYRTQRELENEAVKAGIELTAMRRAEILLEADALGRATAAIEAKRAVEDYQTTMEAEAQSYERRLQMLREFEEQRILTTQESAEMRKRIEQEYMLLVAQTMLDTTSRVASTLDAIAGSMDTSSKKQFEQAKKLSLASAVLKGIESAVSSYAAGAKIAGPPLGAAWAALSLAVTGAQIAKIKSTSFNSSAASGGMSGSGGSGGSLDAPTPNQGVGQQGTQNVTISLVGSRYSREEVRELIQQMNDVMPDGIVLNAGVAA